MYCKATVTDKKSNSTGTSKRRAAQPTKERLNESAAEVGSSQTSVLRRAQNLLFTHYFKNLIYKSSFAYAAKITTYSILLNIILGVAVLLFAFKDAPRPDVFAIDENGRYVRMIPLSEDAMSPGQITNWAGECATRLNTFSFYNYKSELSGTLNDCLTEEAAQDFRRGFELNIAGELEEKQQSYSATVSDAAILTGEAKIGVEQRKAYRVQVGLTVTRYEHQRSPSSEKVIVTIDIVRVPIEESWRGVKIYNYEEE